MDVLQVHKGPCCERCAQIAMRPWIDENREACCCGAPFRYDHDARVCPCGYLYEVPGESDEEHRARARAHSQGHGLDQVETDERPAKELSTPSPPALSDAERLKIEKEFRQRQEAREAQRAKRKERRVKRAYLDKEGIVQFEYEGDE